MASINSPLGRRNLAMNQAQAAQQKVLTVSNEDESDPNYIPPEFRNTPEAIQAAEGIESVTQFRKQKQLETTRISSASKENIELLLGLGRAFDEVEVDGVVFSLRSLKSTEVREIVKHISEAESKVDAMFDDRKLLLSKSIYKIDNQPIELVLSGLGFDQISEVIDQMDDALIDYIHDRYKKMVREKSKSFHTKTDVENTAEEIKK